MHASLPPCSYPAQNVVCGRNALPYQLCAPQTRSLCMGSETWFSTYCGWSSVVKNIKKGFIKTIFNSCIVKTKYHLTPLFKDARDLKCIFNLMFYLLCLPIQLRDHTHGSEHDGLVRHPRKMQASRSAWRNHWTWREHLEQEWRCHLQPSPGYIPHAL